MASPRTFLLPIREITSRARPQVLKRKIAPFTQTRFASGDPVKVSQLPPGTKGPNEDQLPHVSEEQAAMDKVMGDTPPDIEQGTPVQEILERDKDAQKNAPQVLKEKIQSNSDVNQKRSYSTSARRLNTLTELSPVTNTGLIYGMEYPDAGPGHKFALPDLEKISRLDHLKRRYDPVVDQVTKALMRHGKLSIAQKNMAVILNTLRTSPAPQVNPQFPSRTLLIADSSASPLANNSALATPQETNVQYLPRSALPLHPVEYLTTIVDSVAPLIKIRQQRGVAGGGASLPIPVPLGIRQRRRTAIQWILTAADNRKETKLADRVAKEMLKVADGSSGVWERRAMVHKLGVSARSNVKPGMRMRKIKRM